MSCTKHQSNPYHGYSECAGCELEAKDRRIADLEVKP